MSLLLIFAACFCVGWQIANIVSAWRLLGRTWTITPVVAVVQVIASAVQITVLLALLAVAA